MVMINYIQIYLRELSCLEKREICVLRKRARIIIRSIKKERNRQTLKRKKDRARLI